MEHLIIIVLVGLIATTLIKALAIFNTNDREDR